MNATRKNRTNGGPVIARMLARTVAVLLISVSPAAAHHILGVPHYAYDEDYPQTPVLTYRAEVGRFEVKATAYPGELVAREPVTLHVYITDHETGSLYDGSVTMRIDRKRGPASPVPVYGPIAAELDERIYKFHPVFPLDARYRALLAFYADDQAWSVELPMVVGEPVSIWGTVGWVATAAALLLFIGRAVAIKVRRRRTATPLVGVSG